MIEYKDSGLATAAPAGALAGNGRTVEGLLTVWNAIDYGGDRTIRGAFLRTIERNPNPPLLWSHKADAVPIGRVLAMIETDQGVYFQGTLNSTGLAADVLEAVKTGALSGVSYGYDAKGKRYSTVDGKTVRDLLQVDLLEVSLCNFPMLDAARLSAYSKSWLADALAIGRMEAGGGYAPAAVVTCGIKAQLNMIDREVYAGKTRRQVLYDAAYEIQELRKLAGHGRK